MAQKLPIPGKPTAWKELTKNGKSAVKIAWSFSTDLEVEVDSYTILFKVVGITGNWKQKNIQVDSEKESTHFETIIPLKPNTYVFAIKVFFEDGDVSEMSEESEKFTLDLNEESENIMVSLKSNILGNVTEVQKGDGKAIPSVYQINLCATAMNQDNSIRKYEIGKNRYNDKVLKERVIMIVGATGSGKSTLINVMVNYLFGFDLDDGKLLKLIDEKGNANQALSQTQAITSYTIHSQDGLKVPNTTITIIDTPGFGDTRGIARDDKIVAQIRDFFTSEDPDLRIDHIDLVGFVTQSSLPRLTPTQRYIFDKILSLFGNDIEDKIMMMLTFADSETPQVISGIKESGFHYKDYYKFNNSAVFTGGKSKSKQESWTMGENSFKKFFEALEKCAPTSITLTRDVLLERHRLQLNMDQMHETIQAGLTKLEELADGLKAVEKFEADMRKHKDFTYTEEVEDLKKHSVGNNIYTTHCVTCNRTCHDNCDYVENEDKNKCKVMNYYGYCTVCPGRCYYQCHQHRPFVISVTRRKVTQTIGDLQERYAEGKKGRLTTMELIKKLREDFEIHQKQTLLLIDHTRQSVERLKEIALKPNPTSTIDYIDTLIDAEMGDQKKGFLKRVETLRELRKKAEELSKLIKGGLDPFSAHRGVLVELKQKESEVEASSRFSSMFRSVKRFFNIGRTKEGLSREPKKQKKTLPKPM